jgi:hypothetical protein
MTLSGFFKIITYLLTLLTYLLYLLTYLLNYLITYLLNYLLTYSLTHSRSWALLEEPPIVQPLKDFPAFYRTRRFNTVFTRALHWSLSWAISNQSTPFHPISLRSILILSTKAKNEVYQMSIPKTLLFFFKCAFISWIHNHLTNR